jgi:RNA polymerase sigma-70 factor (ECF subfamily)
MDPLADLFRRFAVRGDVGALGEVFDRTAPRLLRLALHLVRSREDAEDLVQATFVLAMQKADTFAPDRPLLPWLSGLLAGEAKNLARRNAHRRAEPLSELAGACGSVTDDAERRERVELLRRHAAALPAEQRQVLLLQLEHGLSPAAIAEVLDQAPGTIRMRLHRGLRALRGLLPSALALWLASALPARGLAAVRAAVMRRAAAHAHVAAAAAATGGIAMKKLLAAFAALLALWLAWTVIRPEVAVTRTPHALSDAAPVRAGDAPIAASDGAVRTQREHATDSRAARSTGTVRVRVVAADGDEPIPDVAVVLWIGDEDRPPLDATAVSLRTDAAGGAHATALVPGRWRASVPFCDDAVADAEVTAGAETDVTLTIAALPLQGVVVDDGGATVAGATVILCNERMWNRQPNDLEPAHPERCRRVAARTAADGTFRCVAGPFEDFVAAQHPGWLTSLPQLTGTRLSTWRLVLRRAGRELHGTVRDEQRRPVTGATVLAKVYEAARRTRDGTWLGGSLGELAVTDAAGAFAFTALPPGDVLLTATAAVPGVGSAFVPAAESAPGPIAIELVTARTLVGRVRDSNGAAVGGVGIAASPAAVPGGGVRRSVRADGSFRVAVPRRAMVLEVCAPGQHPAWARFDVAADHPDGEALELVVPARPALRGRVVDADDRPLADWHVRVRDAAGGEWTAYAQSDARGGFELLHVGAARLHFAATWRGGDLDDPAAQLRDVAVQAQDVVLRVANGAVQSGSVRGRLRDPAGAPLTGATVSLQRDGGGPPGGATGADGAFRIERVLKGRYELLVHGSDGPRRLRDVQVGFDEVDLGDVTVLPVARVRVEFTDAAGAPWRQWLPGVAVQRADGTFVKWLAPENRVCEGPVEPGPLVLAVEGEPDLLPVRVPLELLPGESRTVTVKLVVGRSVELVFAGDGRDAPIDGKDVLHVEAIDERGQVALRAQWRRSPHGSGDWESQQVLAFGRYRIAARSDSGRRYALELTVGDDDLPAQRRITVPRVP